MAILNPGGAAFFLRVWFRAGGRASGLVLFLLLLADCSHQTIQPQSQPAQKQITLFYQSNRNGEMEPCGCQKKPFGGIDREANALAKAHKEGNIVWYVDAGNMLGPESTRLSLKHRQRKARALLAMLKEMKLDVFSPGPSDYALGVDFLKDANEKSGIPFISTNHSSFRPYHVEERGGVRVGFLGVTPSSQDLKTEDPDSALRKWLPQVTEKADLVVLLSQLGAEKDEKIAEAFPEIHLVIGSDPNLALDEPLLFSGRTLQLDPHRYGYQLGRLDLSLRLPFNGFYSPKAIADTHERLSEWQARLVADPQNEIAAQYIEKIQREALLAPQEGGSEYANRLIPLDAQTFGKPNSISHRIRAYREDVRRSALAE